MSIDEIREELLAQHDTIRSLAVEAKAIIAHRRMVGTNVALVVRDLLSDIERELAWHNAVEERELERLLPTIDAWGAIRDEHMHRRHALEHEGLAQTLCSAHAVQDTEQLMIAADNALTDLLNHMEYEEDLFLNREILTDNTIRVEAGG